ncbi:MAG TPA: sialidase family protein [Permianibacter sp.]|nr:sialidase family protein [Permianibacter sp.]
MLRSNPLRVAAGCCRRGVLAALASLALVTGMPCVQAQARAQEAPAWTELPIAAGPGSQYPSLYSDGKRVWMSWLQLETPTPEIRRASLWFAVLDEQQWSAPQRIAQGDDWFVNWADFPSLVALPDGTLAAHWLRKSAPDSYAYDVQLAFSHDAGKRWSAPITPHDDGTRTEHGFVSLLPEPDNALSLMWLDGRESAGHHERMQLRHARFDRHGKKLAEQIVDGDTCTCCQTSAVVRPLSRDAGHELWLAYRDHSQAEIRDIAFLRWREGRWSEPALVHADGWEIPGCPVNGPALAQAQGQVAVVWYTAAEQTPQVRLAFADPDGRFGLPLRLDDGAATGRVALAMPDGQSAIAAWLERRGEQAVWRLRKVSRSAAAGSGQPSAGPIRDLTTLALARSSGFPRLAIHGTTLILAWTEIDENQPPRVRSARLPLSALD